uniref:glycosyl hydrolase 2 galactose-binding domain-containing protein n=1 Tax=Novosphingobium sp. TaxID=1874826 RepID=UPI00345B868D
MMARSVIGAGLLLAPAALLADVGPQAGPWDARVVSGGSGIERELPATSRLLSAEADWTVIGWVRRDAADAGTLVTMGGGARAIGWTEEGQLVAVTGGVVARSARSLAPGRWTHVAVVRTGDRLRFYLDGGQAGEGPTGAARVDRRIAFAPVIPGQPHAAATVVGLGVDDTALTAAAIARAAAAPPDFAAAHVWEVGRGWEWQFKANTGYWRPQDPWTLPRGKAMFDAPVAKPPRQAPVLEDRGDGRWQVNGWTLAAAPGVAATGDQLSRPGRPGSGTWLAANVPGTVLGTLVDRGVYPDPYRGLNNMAIPESLARQDYWYRAEFDLPSAAVGRQVQLVLNGANYASEVWINGVRAGDLTGAFIRGQFRFAPVAGRNAVAIRVSPPPHPGTPHEESVSAGPGENGGQLAIDGPTFVATEGWDWIPGIRDRNTGLWQPVELRLTGPLEIGDPAVITDLPLPRTDSAEIHVTVPVRNLGAAPLDATVTVAFDGIEVRRTERIAPGESRALRFTPATDPALRVAHPKLWWPNGYGDPVLHTMRITAAGPAGPSDLRSLRFGIREVSYDLALMDRTGKLARVNVQTTDGRLAGTPLIDVTHPNI